MQQVTNAERALLDRYAKISLTVYLNGTAVKAGVGACEVAYSCGDAESFSFGNACATSVKLSLAASMPGIKGQSLRIVWAVNGTDYPLFDGKVEAAPITAGRTDIEAWDVMYYGGSDAFVPTLAMKQDIDAAAAFSAIASAMGVSAADDALQLLSGITISGGLGHLTEDTSSSAVAGYIAGLIGGNAMIDRAGRLTVRKISPTDFETEPYSGGATADGAEYFISGITLQREEIVTVKNDDGTSAEQELVLEYGAGDGTLMVNNPLADQNAADRAFAALEGIRFRPGSYSFPGGLLLEPGDVITVNSMDGSYSVACVMISMSFDGGVKTSVSCGGYAPEGGAQGSINQALATLYADFARLRTLVAENAQIVSAKITNLTVDDIAAGRIRSTDFAVEELQEIYPGAKVFPSSTLYPNNGEQIIRGFEIDFSTGIIRGAFWSEPIAALEAANSELQSKVIGLETELSYTTATVESLQASNVDLQQKISELENEIAAQQNNIVNLEEQIADLQIAEDDVNTRLAKLETGLIYPKSM